jgi:hypothetical protein
MPTVQSNVVPVIRLTFEYHGNQIRLVGREDLTDIPPASSPLTGFANQSGFWVELRDAAGKLLYRQILHKPIRFEAELLPDDPAAPRTPRQLPIANPSGRFSVVVPALADAATVVLVSSPLTHDAPASPAAPVASFNLRGPNP